LGRQLSSHGSPPVAVRTPASRKSPAHGPAQRQIHFLRWPSIVKPVVNEFDHLILKINQSALVFPPVVETVAPRFDGVHCDSDPRRGYFVLEGPVYATSWKEIGRNDPRGPRAPLRKCSRRHHQTRQ